MKKIIEKYKDTLSINEINTLLKIDSKSILFFDLDGTLIDTDYSNFLSYKKAIQEIINPSYDILYDINKRFTRQTIKELFPTINQINFEKIIQRKNILYKNYLFETKLNKLFIEILKILSKTNITVLVTHSHKDRAVMLLKHHMIFDKFTYRFYQQNINEGKVNKFQYVLTSLNINSNSIFLFENESLEIEKAIILGIPIENIINVKLITSRK